MPDRSTARAPVASPLSACRRRRSPRRHVASIKIAKCPNRGSTFRRPRVALRILRPERAKKPRVFKSIGSRYRIRAIANPQVRGERGSERVSATAFVSRVGPEVRRTGCRNREIFDSVCRVRENLVSSSSRLAGGGGRGRVIQHSHSLAGFRPVSTKFADISLRALAPHRALSNPVLVLQNTEMTEY